MQQHALYELIWIRRTCDYIQLNSYYYACCLVVGLWLALGLGIDLVSGW